jgi:hypothetical protein
MPMLACRQQLRISTATNGAGGLVLLQCNAQQQTTMLVRKDGLDHNWKNGHMLDDVGLSAVIDIRHADTIGFRPNGA